MDFNDSSETMSSSLSMKQQTLSKQREVALAHTIVSSLSNAIVLTEMSLIDSVKLCFHY